MNEELKKYVRRNFLVDGIIAALAIIVIVVMVALPPESAEIAVPDNSTSTKQIDRDNNSARDPSVDLPTNPPNAPDEPIDPSVDAPANPTKTPTPPDAPVAPPDYSKEPSENVDAPPIPTYIK